MAEEVSGKINLILKNKFNYILLELFETNYFKNCVKNKLIFFIFLCLIYGISEIIIIIGLPEIFKIITNSDSDKLVFNPNINLFILNIDSIEKYFLIFIINSFFKIILIKHMTVFGASITSQLTALIYKYILNIDYNEINKKELNANLTTRMEIFYNYFVIPSLYFILSVFLLISSLIGLIFLQSEKIYIAIIIFLLFYLSLFYITKNFFNKNDKNILKHSANTTDLVSILIKDLKGIKTNKDYINYETDIFDTSKKLRSAMGLNFFLGVFT